MNADTKNAIRNFVLKHRGSQAELASMTGVSKTFLSQWIRGRATSARLDRDVMACMEELKQRIMQRGELVAGVVALVVGGLPYAIG